MHSTFSKTVDPLSERPSLTGDERGAVVAAEILFHPNLGRVGERALLGLSSEPGPPQVIGRDEPSFGRDEPGARGLLDPCISRRQVVVRWLPDEGLFRVDPSAEARRPVRLLDPSGRDLGAPPARVPPGTLVAIGDRVLLLLSVRPGLRMDDDLGILGHSAGVVALRHRISVLADFPDPVLIQGETGAGKELVAQALHARSRRRSRPMLALNCAAMPEALLESELFGYAKGSFSEAKEAKKGMFASASGGTLFLDEIGEMALPLQAKLLRVLETGRVRPVGGTTEEPVDVRVVAATHRDLLRDVEQSKFRADLYARIESPHIDVPSLRERRDDIPLLFSAFLFRRATDYARQAGVGWEKTPLAGFWREPDAYPPALPMSHILALLGYDWPRNVRELSKHAVEVIAALVQGLAIQPPALARRSWPPSSAPKVPQAPQAPPPSPPAPPVAERERPERAALDQLLEANNYNQAEVARALDVPYTTLDRWMRELGVVRPKDLSREQVQAAWQQAQGNVAEMARVLRVSARGLKARMKELGLEGLTFRGAARRRGRTFRASAGGAASGRERGRGRGGCRWHAAVRGLLCCGER